MSHKWFINRTNKINQQFNFEINVMTLFRNIVMLIRKPIFKTMLNFTSSVSHGKIDFILRFLVIFVHINERFILCMYEMHIVVIF